MTKASRSSAAVGLLSIAAWFWIAAGLSAQAPAAPAASPEPAKPTLTIRTATAVATAEYKDDLQLADVIRQLSGAGGGSIEFSAGVYEFGRGINLQRMKNISLIGRAGVIFRLRKLDEWGLIKIAEARKVADKVLVVDHPELMKVGARYQLFFPDQHGNRFLECSVAAIEGANVKLAFTNATHPNLDEIPAGTFVVPEINFFDGWQCSDFRVRDIVFDGGVDIGTVKLNGQAFYGHTTHCGLLFRNSYGKANPRPAAQNITIEGCTFRNLLGRGAVAYNTANVNVRGCQFEYMRVEALEIDHWSANASIVGCVFKECGCAIQLNDCNEVVVTGCRVADSGMGIHVLDSLHDLNTNHDLAISGNLFARTREGGIVMDAHADENVINSNIFRNCLPFAVDLAGDRVMCTGNLITGSTECGIQLRGKDCVTDGNLISGAPGAAGFVPIKK